MNPDFDPEQPDLANDPLLAALRQQLGASFGRPPSPQTWAGIRRRLPPPRPWWRRPRLLLPALTLLLTLCTVVGVLVARRPAPPAASTARPAKSPVAVAVRQPLAAGSAATAAPVSSATTSARTALRAAAAPTASQPASAVLAGQPVASVSAGSPVAATDRPATAAHAAPPTGQPVATASAPAAAVNGLAARHHSATIPAPAADEEAASAATTSRPAAGSARLAAANQHEAHRAVRDARHRLLLAATSRRQARHRAIRAASEAAGWPVAPGRAGRRGTQPGATSGRESAASLAAHQRQQPAQSVPGSGNELPSLAARPADAAALLTGRPVPLLLLSPTPPATLALLPDSSRPRPPFRRWSVQVLAGPTLSYRAVPTVSSQAATNVPSPFYTNFSGGSYASYERPALGWGAQVQVRRVLDGRWAAALGLGYHQYATQLNLELRQPGDSLGRLVQLRDTYNLLTVPLQFDYALGWLRGPFGASLLAGAELGWYRGGRVTEGSGCACRQRTFTGATDSPYNAVSVAFSLGLDLRYRLGGPAGRWQLLVQPTGRYVATPFVRNDAAGYVRRQPYSLGLLAGLAWDWR